MPISVLAAQARRLAEAHSEQEEIAKLPKDVPVLSVDQAKQAAVVNRLFVRLGPEPDGPPDPD